MAGSENFHGKITGRISETGHMSGRITTPDIREYTGPYEVVPGESEQTLLTEGKRMTDNVTVDAVPSDYVGSGIDRNDSSDLTASGPTVTVPAGYYAEESSKEIPAGSATTPFTPVDARDGMEINVSEDGVISAHLYKDYSVTPVVEAGYVETGTEGTVRFAGYKFKSLFVQKGVTITPTETEQTAVQAQKYTTGEVKVGAIPDDYVGSAVPRRTKNDIDITKIVGPGGVQKTVAIAAKGYYESATTKDIPTGTATTPATSITANPTVSVDSNGLVAASVSASQSVTPTVNEGYVMSGTAGTVSVQGSSTLQLSTQAAATITPIESEQTAVAAGKYTTGAVKVGAVPSDYVGSGVTRKAAETYVPNKTAPQVIQAGQYLTGDQTIGKIPDEYYDMSGDLAWLGPDATLVKEFSLPDVKLADTDFANWTPSTTAADMLAGRTAGTFVATDAADYDYIMVFHTVIPFVYKEGATDKARPLFLAAVHIQEAIRRPSSYANIQAENDNNTVHAIAFTAGNFLRYFGSTQGSVTYTWNTSYGFYGTYTAATMSSATAASPTVTVKAPKVTARCSTTYMSTANAALIDQDKTVIKQSCKVYRVKKSGLIQGAYDEIIRLVNEVDPE